MVARIMVSPHSSHAGNLSHREPNGLTNLPGSQRWRGLKALPAVGMVIG